jgi:hypothetical protein
MGSASASKIDVALEEGGVIGRGDAVRLTHADLGVVRAGAEGAEILYWQMQSELEHWKS